MLLLGTAAALPVAAYEDDDRNDDGPADGRRRSYDDRVHVHRRCGLCSNLAALGVLHAARDEEEEEVGYCFTFMLHPKPHFPSFMTVPPFSLVRCEGRRGVRSEECG